ncbi:uncharacterized protein RAG0_03051 [Rhynchosporium agropyri]|uniref:C2H2-type domain-containing protein n=1 Tax=Rhynchosporium agropyri TaxID=914238 RepID=A0A1E1K397_9HELO|nr:uncharacterized protein RAG0_03051 [Rhynchosporium agropyri]
MCQYSTIRSSPSDTDSLFDDEADSDTYTDLDSLVAEEHSAGDEDLFDDEIRHPPAHYLANAANLDVKEHHDQYEQYLSRCSRRLDWPLFRRYCTFQAWDPAKCYNLISVQFIHGFLSWACDQRRGKGGRRRPGIKYASSLETFWKCYLISYRIETGRKIDPMIQVNGQDDVMIFVVKKGLDFTKRPSATMYAEDLAEFARVLLATTEMTFIIGWLRVQTVLFCQLAGITGNRPEALVELRYRHLKLTLIRDPKGVGRPRLFVELTSEFTKRYLGAKDMNEFKIPDIIYDPTLVLSPHVFLLGMLFKARAFKSPSIDCPERLYSLKVLKGLNEQPLPLRDEMDDEFIFCEAVDEAQGIRIARDLQLSSGSLRYRMKVRGEITGFGQVLKPYNLRDGSAKALNECPDVSDSLQNKILQHASIGTFLKHYLNHINVDLQGVYRRRDAQKDLVRFACSMSRSIDPRRPRKLTLEQTASINDLPYILKLRERVNNLYKVPIGSRKDDRLQKATKRLFNEKQRERRALLKDIKERYKSEQPMKDSERQLSGMVVDEDTRDALVRADMSPEQLSLVDAVLTLPGNSPGKELQRRITAINAITLYWGIEEGAPSRHARRGPLGTVVSPPLPAVEPDVALRQAISYIKSDKRPKVCFVCIGSPHLTMRERVAEYATSGSLSRHFMRMHVSKLQDGQFVDCMDCGVRLKTRKDLLIHAERSHGTVSRGPAERMIV